MLFFLVGTWREGLTNCTERGSGSVPVAWREGLAAHILSKLRKALSVDRSPGVDELSSS